MASNLSPIVYLLCELKSRDLYSRLLIGDYVTRAGYPVVIGAYQAVLDGTDKKRLPLGACLFATANSIQSHNMETYRDSGGMVVASDEEALALSRNMMLANVAPNCLKNCDVFAANNQLHMSALASSEQTRIVVTGNARIDRTLSMTPPRPMAEKYILFNTGFGLINSLWGDVKRAVLITADAMNLDPNASATVHEMQERVAVENGTFNIMIPAIRWAADNTRMKVVIRPHPSEDPRWWLNKFGGSSKVSVVTNSDPIPWIKHAAVVVHADSTTGLEAAALNVPCVNISHSEAWSERFIMRDVNLNVSTFAQVRDALDMAMNDGEWPSTDAAKLFPPGGARNIAELLISQLPPPHDVGVARWGQSFLSYEVKKRIRQKFPVSRAEIGRSSIALDEFTYLIPPSPR